MYKIGQKVRLKGTNLIAGYIVKMEIDPFEEADVASEAEDWIIYTVRVYKRFYRDGYADFGCTERDIENADD